jgi:hypothetical protein
MGAKMRNLIFILILISTLIGCEGYEMTTTQNTKPTIIEFNPPAGANVEPPPAGILSAGFVDGNPDKALYAKYFNALERKISGLLIICFRMSGKYMSSSQLAMIPQATEAQQHHIKPLIKQGQ